MVHLNTENGEFIIVLDSQDRENEGDLIIAAESITDAQMAFLVRYTRLVHPRLPSNPSAQSASRILANIFLLPEPQRSNLRAYYLRDRPPPLPAPDGRRERRPQGNRIHHLHRLQRPLRHDRDLRARPRPDVPHACLFNCQIRGLPAARPHSPARSEERRRAREKGTHGGGGRLLPSGG